MTPSTDFSRVEPGELPELMPDNPGFNHVATHTSPDLIVFEGEVPGVTLDGEPLDARHLIVCPRDPTYKPTWSVMNAIKRAIVGDVWGYEAHPPDDELVDDANLYHLITGVIPPITL